MPLDKASLLRTGELVVSAIASDEELFDKLVLKGGNALQLIHKIGARASIDYDFSMQDDVEDSAWLAARLERAVQRHFELEGYRVLDFKFTPRPARRPIVGQTNPRWGGYNATFKYMSAEDWAAAEGVGSQRFMKGQRAALAHGDGARHDPTSEADEALTYRRNIGKKVEVEISKYEYTEGKQEVEVDGYPVYVYTLPMIAAEKLRAICQQMAAHGQRRNPAPRPRDFYDIHACVQSGQVDLTQHLATVRGMFAAKEVPLSLLNHIPEYRSFHANAWGEVVSTVTGEKLEFFDHYFDFVLNEVARLQAAGVE
ncbi:hypothetical protein D7X96_21795 [Corallococcus interemptor]|uniref:Nucleotidyl transferase AbiEii/AbiGii toxin family protein n=1 Tax=Corallococcus interemptor TaxID=2316720 RepID=A0A3A8QC68_9BACT|nr:nucleotidyl transferase AbiEii/AbiGii toxin family protein [Corallococcus interemptor]RKH66283.1 hypothetical protein D7X96_21795 [Corallococcus interemptor]